MAPAPEPSVVIDAPRAPLRRRIRATAMGLSTVLGIARRGYFIPHRYAADLPTPDQHAAYPEIEAIFAAQRPAFLAMLADIDAHRDALEAIGQDAPPAPRWHQGWFPRLDAAAAYAIVRARRPKRVLEVGSGHSTRFMVRAARDAGLSTAFTAIDPAPRAVLDGLAIAHRAGTVQQVGDPPFQALRPGDVLFIDSSHILMPGSDVDFLINRVWPSLPAGLIVHFHDIFLPDGYPASWEWRGYNEQLGVAPLLTSGAARVLFSSRFVATRMAAEMAGTVISRLPLMDSAVETSLWLEKTDPG